MTRAVLVIPPFIKYSSGPLLGPALLQAAARCKGHQCTVLDLNSLFIQPRASKRIRHGTFIGDHDKPPSKGPSSLPELETKFFSQTILPGLPWGADVGASCRVRFGFMDHQDVKAAAKFAARTSFGVWAKNKMVEHCQEPPQVVGISLLHAGQLIPAVAASTLAKEIWPEAIIFWGGPHVSGLGEALKEDIWERSFAADVFVSGHAEETFADLLAKVAEGTLKQCYDSKPMVLQGNRGPSVAPIFENLGTYDTPLTLPAQSSLGCAYGRCAFCTYPAIEPSPLRLPLLLSVGSVAEMAHSLGASIAIKDSLVTPLRLREIAGCISGRAPWSACTKISPKLNRAVLADLRKCGLSTLEIGLESLLTDTQQRLRKVQPQSLYENLLADVAHVEGLTLIVNYMTGFPWENSVEAELKLEEAKDILSFHLGEGGRVEHNTFELERLSKMARSPSKHGIKEIKAWPWASVLEYTSITKDGKC